MGHRTAVGDLVGTGTDKFNAILGDDHAFLIENDGVIEVSKGAESKDGVHEICGLA